MFITDFLLLVTMLIGLLRMRHGGGGTLALGRLLWTQVRSRQLLRSHVSLHYLM
jgi:hypothetical protein